MEAERCALCGGELAWLGKLGARCYARCVGCGMIERVDDNEVNEDNEKKEETK